MNPTLSSWLAFAVVATNRRPFRWCYRALYRLTQRAFVASIVGRFPGAVRSIYLRRGLTAGAEFYGLSDVDLLVLVTATTDTATREAIVKHWLRCRRWLPLLDPDPSVATVDDLRRRSETDPAVAFRLAEGKRTWRLLHGEDIVSELPGLSGEAEIVGRWTELRTYWTFFADTWILSSSTDAYGSRKREYVLYKCILAAFETVRAIANDGFRDRDATALALLNDPAPFRGIEPVDPRWVRFVGLCRRSVLRHSCWRQAGWKSAEEAAESVLTLLRAATLLYLRAHRVSLAAAPGCGFRELYRDGVSALTGRSFQFVDASAGLEALRRNCRKNADTDTLCETDGLVWNVSAGTLAMAKTTLAIRADEAWTKVHFVAPQGSDFADGSRQNPWRTLQRAADVVEPGDRVFVARGSYRGFALEDRRGTASLPIEFLAEAGTVIDEPRPFGGDGIALLGAGYITIEGFEIRAMPRHGMVCGAGTNGVRCEALTLRANRCASNQSIGICINGGDDITVENNVVEGSRGHGIYVGGPAKGLRLVGNHVAQNHGSGIVLDGAGPAVLVAGATLRDNRLADNGLGGGGGLSLSGVEGATIERNVVVQTRSYAVSLCDGARGNAIAGNWFDLTKGYAAVSIQPDSIDNRLLDNVTQGGELVAEAASVAGAFQQGNRYVKSGRRFPSASLKGHRSAAPVVVTGAAGFIGANLCRALVAEGYAVVGIDDLSAGSAEHLPDEVELFRLDIRDADLTECLEGVSTIFHLAAMSRPKECEAYPARAVSVNVAGTANLLHAAVLAGVRHVVYADTAAAYGGVRDFPLGVKELKPINVYGSTKRAGGVVAEGFAASGQLALTTVRYFNVYGPRQRTSGVGGPLVATFINDLFHSRVPTIFGDGKVGRDFVHVDDVNRFHLRLLEDPSLVGGVYNLGTGVEHSVLEVYDLVAQCLGSDVRPRFVEAKELGPARSVADITETLRTGWRPETSLEEGIRQLVRQLRADVSTPPLAGRLPPRQSGPAVDLAP